MPEVAQAEKTLAETSKQYEDEYAKIQEEFQKLYAEYQKLDADASTAQSIKDRRLQELQERNTKAQQFAQTAQQDLEKKQAELMQPIQEKMIKAIKTVGTNNNFTMIFPAEVPAYIGSDVTDVTPLVKAQLGIK
jgi:outer membrane protein